MAIFKKQYIAKVSVDSNTEELDKLIANAIQKRQELGIALNALKDFELTVDFKGLSAGDGKSKKR